MRVYAWCFKFIRKLKERQSKIQVTTNASSHAALVIIDYKKAFRFLTKYAQELEPPFEAVISNLGLFLNKDNIYCCKSRQNSKICNASKYPIYLPFKSYLTKLLVLKVYIISCHADILNTLSLICYLCSRVDGVS